MATKEKVEVLNVHQRISRIMSEIDYIKKDKSINFGKGGGFTVVGHDAVTKLIHPLLVKHGVNIIPTIKQIIQEGNRSRVDLEFRWVNIDNPDDHFITEASGYGIDQQDKGIGKGWSVAQRYTVLKTLHLETGDKDIEDDDINHVEVTKEENLRNKEEKMVEDFAKEVQETLNREQQQEFVAHVSASGMEVETAVELIKLHGFAKTKDIPVDKLEALKNEITFIAKGAANVRA
jgi:hypothetical protein|tara:strand:- start:413 stop:1111 length:699 start_codon:yes stop_codon:yes gene_type:complete